MPDDTERRSRFGDILEADADVVMERVVKDLDRVGTMGHAPPDLADRIDAAMGASRGRRRRRFWPSPVGIRAVLAVLALCLLTGVAVHAALPQSHPISVLPRPRYDVGYALRYAHMQATVFNRIGRHAYVAAVQYGRARDLSIPGAMGRKTGGNALLWVVTYADPSAHAPRPGQSQPGSGCPETEYFVDATNGTGLGVACLVQR